MAGMTAGSGNQAYTSDPAVKEKTQTVFGQWCQWNFREANVPSLILILQRTLRASFAFLTWQIASLHLLVMTVLSLF